MSVKDSLFQWTKLSQRSKIYDTPYRSQNFIPPPPPPLHPCSKSKTSPFIEMLLSTNFPSRDISLCPSLF